MMTRLFKITLIGSLLFPFIGLAQQKKTEQVSTKLNFSEMWIWEYANAKGIKEQMAIYREPKSNYWLFTPEDTNFLEKDEMTLWFIAKPSGEVLQAYQEHQHSDKKKLIKYQLPVEKRIKLPNYWKATGKIKKFGYTNLGSPKFIGKEYKISYDKTTDQSTFYLATTNANFSVLSRFNDLNIDAKLPIRFPKEIPANFITLSENTLFSGGSAHYIFNSISQTEYYINLSEFELKN